MTPARSTPRVVLAASPGELLACAVVMLHERIAPELVIYSLDHSEDRPRGKAFAERYCRALGWPVGFDEGGRRLRARARRAAVLDDLAQRARLRRLERRLLPCPGARTVPEIWFTYFRHEYVQNYVGLHPDARRVLYPHAFGLMRGHVTGKLEVGARANGVERVPLKRWDRVYGLLRMGREVCLDEGIDEAFTFTSISPPVETTRISAAEFSSRCSEIAARLDPAGLCPDARELRDSVIVCLSEYRDHGIYMGDLSLERHARALRYLFERIRERFGECRLVIKLHPRSVRAETQSFVEEVCRATQIGRQDISFLPEPLNEYPLQLLEGLLEPRAVASIFSSAGFGMNAGNYGSSGAIRILTEGIENPLVRSLRKGFQESCRLGYLYDLDCAAECR